MLQNGAEKHRGGDNRSRQSQQHLHQEENCPTFPSSQIKSRGSSSPLSSVKPIATKVKNQLFMYINSPSINIKFSVIFKTMCLFKSQNVYTDFWWSLNDPGHSIQIFYFDMFVNSKASVTLENDLRRYGSFHIKNSTAQQQVHNHHKIFNFSC